MTVFFPGIRQNTFLDDVLDFSGSIVAGGTAQLLLPQQPGRDYLSITNTSATDSLYVSIGPAKATATLTGTAVTAVTVNNGGIGYTVAPQVIFLGGVRAGDYSLAPGSTDKILGVQTAGFPAQAAATIAAGAVSAVTVNNGGSGYLVVPTVYLVNPWPVLGGGAYAPAATASTTGQGIVIPANTTFTISGMTVPASAIAINGFTTGDTFHVKVGGPW
jgi:hypothetical protein